LKNLTRVTLLLAEPELLVPQKVPPGQKLVPARVLLDLLVIQDKNVLRVNANVMKNVLIRKLVKTTIVSMFAKLKPAKKTSFAKLFDMCLSVVEIMSQNLKSQETFLLSENPTKILKNNQLPEEPHLQILLSLEADTTDSVGKGTFPYPSYSDSNSRVYIESMQKFYKRVYFKWPTPHSTEVPRTNSCMKPTIRKILSEKSHQKYPIRKITPKSSNLVMKKTSLTLTYLPTF